MSSFSLRFYLGRSGRTYQGALQHNTYKRLHITHSPFLDQKDRLATRNTKGYLKSSKSP